VTQLYKQYQNRSERQSPYGLSWVSITLLTEPITEKYNYFSIIV